MFHGGRRAELQIDISGLEVLLPGRRAAEDVAQGRPQRAARPRERQIPRQNQPGRIRTPGRNTCRW